MKIDNFKSAISKSGGLLHSNRFNVFITPPPGVVAENLTTVEALAYDSSMDSILCTSVSMPGKAIGTQEFSRFGTTFRYPVTMAYTDLAMTFRMTSQNSTFRMFSKWMNSTVDPEKHNVKYPEDYLGVAEVHALDGADKIALGRKFVGIYPINIMMGDFSDQAQNTVAELTVQFAYRKWTELFS